MNEEIINTVELARRTGISASVWNKRRLNGDTPPFLKLGRAVRYRWVDVQEWLLSRQRTSTSAIGQAN